MDTEGVRNSKTKWRSTNLLPLYILLLAAPCQGDTSHTEITKPDVKLDNNLDSIHCHSCYSSSNKESYNVENYVDVIDDLVGQLNTFTDQHLNLNKTVGYLEKAVEDILDKALSKDRVKIFEGVEVKPAGTENDTKIEKRNDEEGRALFSKYTYEYRMYQKIKNFVNTHILSINLPMAAKCEYDFKKKINELDLVQLNSHEMLFCKYNLYLENAKPGNRSLYLAFCRYISCLLKWEHRTLFKYCVYCATCFMYHVSLAKALHIIDWNLQNE